MVAFDDPNLFFKGQKWSVILKNTQKKAKCQEKYWNKDQRHNLLPFSK